MQKSGSSHCRVCAEQFPQCVTNETHLLNNNLLDGYFLKLLIKVMPERLLRTGHRFKKKLKIIPFNSFVYPYCA